MSGGEPSSIKQSLQCAARVPVLSRGYDVRVGVNFELEVYGLVLQFGFAQERILPIDAHAPFGILCF